MSAFVKVGQLETEFPYLYAICSISSYSKPMPISSGVLFYRVMVLDAGLIKEFDSPKTLLQDPNGVFYGMAKNAGLV